MNNIVSIVIPTYNRPLFLERAIKSVLDQSYKNIEIIIIDDNGDNNIAQKETKEIIDAFSSCSNIRYIRNEFNVGGAESRNIGVKNAKGSYISFLDDDDVYDKNKIYEQITVLLENKDVDVCYCGMTYLNSDGEKIGQRNIYVEGSEELIRKHIFRPITGTPALLMKKSVFEKIGGFDNLKRYQDANLIFKILANKYNLKCIRKELVKVYVHQEDRISVNGKWINLEREYIKNAMKYIQLLSHRNAKLLIDKYHIQSCFCDNNLLFKAIISSIKILSFRLININNFLGVLNYIRKYKV